MSTATIEPPVTEAKPAEVVPAPTPAAPTKVDVSAFLNPKVVKDGEVITSPPAPAKKQDAPAPAATTPEPAAKPPSDQEVNFAKLREKAEKAEKRAAELDAQYQKALQDYEEYKKNPVPPEVAEKLTAAEKRAQELQKQLRAADLVRDPEFQAKYSKGIESSLKTMGELLIGAGVDAAEVKRAINVWDEDTLDSLAGNLSGGNRRRFDAAFQKAVGLDAERSMELQDSDNTWNELQKQRQAAMEAQQKSYMDSLKSDRNSVISELMEQQAEVLKDEEVRKQTEQLLDRAAGLNGDKMQPKEVLKTLAATHVLAHHFKRVDAERTQLKEELEATKKTLAERDEFIKGLSGSTPSPSPTNGELKPAGVKVSSLLLNPKVVPR